METLLRLLIFYRSGAGFWFFAQAAHTPDFLFKRLRLLCWNSAEIPMPNMSSLYAWKMHCLCPRPVYIDIIFLDGFVKNSSSDIRGTWEPLSRWEPQVKHSELIKSLAWGSAVHCTFQGLLNILYKYNPLLCTHTILTVFLKRKKKVYPCIPAFIRTQ